MEAQVGERGDEWRLKQRREVRSLECSAVKAQAEKVKAKNKRGAREEAEEEDE